ncbi:hypothetical protein [Streptomyces sp. NBC_01276]|uniref:hypothetical protein n=1 Tax=Streptomyces sp. NBC_01276 TaxID=2903808 RepID=UPI002F909941
MTDNLTQALAADDADEDAGMHPDDRTACHTHQAWAHDCSGRHVQPTAGQLLAAAREVDRIRARTHHH